MLYLSRFAFPDDEKEFDFLLTVKRKCYNSFYPFKVLSARGLLELELEPVTILYGGNGSGKERKLLKHRREHFVIIPAVIVSYISPVKEHTPFCGIEKAAYQLDKGRFARAVQTDHCKLFSGMQSKIYAGESVSFGAGIAI